MRMENEIGYRDHNIKIYIYKMKTSQTNIFLTKKVLIQRI